MRIPEHSVCDACGKKIVPETDDLYRGNITSQRRGVLPFDACSIPCIVKVLGDLIQKVQTPPAPRPQAPQSPQGGPPQ